MSQTKVENSSQDLWRFAGWAAIAVFLALFVGSRSASGQIIASWNSSSPANWLNVSNWSCFDKTIKLSVPCVPNELTNPGTTFIVNIDTSTALLSAGPTTPVEVNSLALGVFSTDFPGGLSLSSGTTLTVDTATDVGVVIPGSVTVASGGVLNDQTATIAQGSGSGGSGVTVTGEGSEWNTSGELDVGVNDRGSLDIEAGGLVTAGSNMYIGGGSVTAGTSGNGTVNVNGAATDGTPSQLSVAGDLIIGQPGTGTLTIGGGAEVDDAQGVISNSKGAVGAVTVTGQGSVWNNSQFVYVGSANGHGTLSIENSGVVNDESAVIGIGSLTNSVSVGTATVDGSGSTWNSTSGANGDGSMIIGYGQGSKGTLTIENGGAVTDTSATLGFNDGATGNATVTGSGSSWSTSGALAVGGDDTSIPANGSLTVESGGLVTAGQGVTVAYAGNGTMTIESGGQLSNGTGSNVGYLSSADGSVVVSGSGSLWNDSGFLNVGTSGKGSLAISSGATVNSGTGLSYPSLTADIASQTGSTGSVTVTGSGTSWNNTGIMNVGNQGQGTLTISGGATVTTGEGDIGVSSGGVGTVTVTDAGILGSRSTWTITTGNLNVGQGGNGSLTIENGALVNVEPTTTAIDIGTDAGSKGLLTVTGSGSELETAGSIFVGPAGTGTLTVSDGGEVSGTLITIGANGTLNGVGGTIKGDVSNNGVVSPGDPGTMTINGNYTQNAGGILNLLVGGQGSGQYDQLDITGNASFDGLLTLDFINGFAPSTGDTFDLLTIGGTATFGSSFAVNLEGLLPGFQYTTSYTNGAFTLSAQNNGSSSVSEPTPLILLGTGLFAVAWTIRRRKGSLS